ncbi:hypothetical protein BH10PLA2_BH10PLA2_38700 [soil metagenome]
MTREKAYLAQVKMCEEKALADLSRREYWLVEAAKWQKRAADEIDGVEITPR